MAFTKVHKSRGNGFIRQISHSGVLAAFLLPLAIGVSGCLQNKTLTAVTSGTAKLDLNATACEQANFSNSFYVYYPSSASCQKAWPSGGCSPAVVLFNGKPVTCVRHEVTTGGTTGGAGTTGTTGGTSSTGTTGTTTSSSTSSTTGGTTGTVGTSSSSSTTGFATSGNYTTGYSTTGYSTTGGCFIAGTMIEMADGSRKAVERVRVGDQVRGVMGKVNRVEKLFVIPHRGLKYSFNGGKFFVSASHPFLTESGWKSLDPMVSVRENPGLRVSQLSEGDVVLTREGSVRLHAIRAVENSETVFNFRTDGDHSYIADGFKVHNVQNKQPTTTNTTGWYSWTTGWQGFE